MKALVKISKENLIKSWMEKGEGLLDKNIGDNGTYGVAYWILKEGTKNKELSTYIT